MRSRQEPDRSGSSLHMAGPTRTIDMMPPRNRRELGIPVNYTLDLTASSFLSRTSPQSLTKIVSPSYSLAVQVVSRASRWTSLEREHQIGHHISIMTIFPASSRSYLHFQHFSLQSFFDVGIYLPSATFLAPFWLRSPDSGTSSRYPLASRI